VRRLDHVEAFVTRAIDNESIAPRGVGHELPNSACAFGGERGGQTTAFDENDSAEFDRDTLVPKNGFQDRPESVDTINSSPELERRTPPV